MYAWNYFQECHSKSDIPQDNFFFTSKFDFNLRNKKVNVSTLYGAETWTLQEIDNKCLGIFKCGAGEGWKGSFGQMVRKIKKYS